MGPRPNGRDGADDALPPDETTAVLDRLTHARGQLDAVIAMIEDDRTCTDTVVQLAAVKRAVSRAGFAVVAAGVQQCVARGLPEESKSRLERLFLSLS